MPPSWHPVPACTPRRRCRRAVLSCSSDGAAAILKSGLEIKNRCSLWDGSGENHAAISKLTSSNQESLHATGLKRGKPCIDSQVWPRNQESMQPLGSGGLQAKPFFFVATEIRIGRGRSLPQRLLQAGHSSLPQRSYAGGPFYFAATTFRRRTVLLCGKEN